MSVEQNNGTQDSENSPQSIQESSSARESNLEREEGSTQIPLTSYLRKLEPQAGPSLETVKESDLSLPNKQDRVLLLKKLRFHDGDLQYGFKFRSPKGSELPPFLRNSLDSFSSWKIMDQAWVENNGQHLDLISLLPPGYTVFYNSDGDIVDSFVNIESKTIIFIGELNTSASLLALAHEIGHIVDLESKSDTKMSGKFGHEHFTQDSSGMISEEELALLLEEERNAWAFALKKLRGYMSEVNGQTLNKGNVLQIIHDYYLQKYSGGIRDRIEAGLVRWMIENSDNNEKELFEHNK